jgi:hypothetical protein
MGDSEFRADVPKNRLYLCMSGFFREDEGPEMLRRLAGELDKLRHNFDVILEMTGLRPGSPETAEMLHKAGELIKARGRRRGVWIISASATTLLQFKRELGGLFEPGTTRTAGSIPEAEYVLETWDTSPGPPAAR